MKKIRKLIEMGTIFILSQLSEEVISGAIKEGGESYEFFPNPENESTFYYFVNFLYAGENGQKTDSNKKKLHRKL